MPSIINRTAITNKTVPSVPHVQNIIGSRHILPDGLDRASNSKNIGVDNLHASCLRWSCDANISHLVTTIITGAGTGSDRFQMGIYECTSTGGIGNLIARTVDGDPSTSGLKALSLNSGSIYLAPGWYWWAIVANVGITVTAYNAGGYNGALISSPMGVTDTIGNSYGYFTGPITPGWSIMPTTVTLTGAIAITVDFPPVVGARVA